MSQQPVMDDNLETLVEAADLLETRIPPLFQGAVFNQAYSQTEIKPRTNRLLDVAIRTYKHASGRTGFQKKRKYPRRHRYIDNLNAALLNLPEPFKMAASKGRPRTLQLCIIIGGPCG